MGIEIRFYANLREIVGSKSIEREIAGGESIESVLRDLCEEFPGLEGPLLNETGSFSDLFLVRKNGSNVKFLEEPLQDGDQLTLTTQIVGG